MHHITPRHLAVAGLTAAVLALAACSPAGTGSGGDGSSPAADVPGVGGTAIGFIMVGPKDDYGYNQAVYEASQVLAEEYPDLEILTAENVPEDDTAATTMEQMIDRGAKIIFATSYGHLDAAQQVAEDHPDVVVVQQGNTMAEEDILPNSGTYFGTVYEPMYLAGIAAGAATESGKLGYVYAFPIPQTIANINAFQRGAQTVRPDVETITVATSSWCDPAAQRDAASSLLSQGVDVLTQHQDCTKTVIDAAEAAGAYTVGYHADASELAPEGWLTGAVWEWAPLYTSIVDTTLAGDFTGSEFNANYRVGYKTGTNPFVLAEFGPSVTEETVASIDEAQAWLGTPEGSPFAGPVLAQDGTEVVAAGVVPDYAEVDAMDYFVQGVVGNLAK
ncbi:BMP family ABC transporter substrate-binding protein [Microbacterium allomyrinae]|uniref:BMP family ABC transporter substrate-binding protein n=1 Tax=Microbacterium allomyrinae TaxID=2830666 RepID=A0A9X1S4K9_9MICO|nr:BMP family ABC transporter substrate-binding protein [Microbacterium allomyrinae]MCC2033208.1 BMP family ABC transporter substrate-binding protein [Microbacterium allomyrinae]